MIKSILIYQDDNPHPLIVIDNYSECPVFEAPNFELLGAELIQVLNRAAPKSKFRLENSEW